MSMFTFDLPRAATLGAGALALVGALWFSFGVRDGADPSDGPRPTAVITPAGGTAAPAEIAAPAPADDVAPADPTAPAVSVRADAAPAIALGAVGSVAVPAASASPSPDAPSAALPSVPPGTGTPPGSADIDLVLDQREPDAGGSAPATAPGVVVPTSYPVSDAAKYFVPREERRPGNLGGPPPLDFPGGPNDPAAGGFAPPPAPGQ